jgi:hypothetical protein
VTRGSEHDCSAGGRCTPAGEEAGGNGWRGGAEKRVGEGRGAQGRRRWGVPPPQPPLRSHVAAAATGGRGGGTRWRRRRRLASPPPTPSRPSACGLSGAADLAAPNRAKGDNPGPAPPPPPAPLLAEWSPGRGRAALSRGLPPADPGLRIRDATAKEPARRRAGGPPPPYPRSDRRPRRPHRHRPTLGRVGAHGAGPMHGRGPGRCV